MSKLLVALMCGATFVIGFFVAIDRFRYELQVDHDSGKLRNVMAIGPFTLRVEEHPARFLGTLTLPTGGEGITGNANWKVALRFYGSSQISPSLSQGVLANQIIGLDHLLTTIPSDKAQRIKAVFLSKLNRDGEDSAISFVSSMKTEILDDLDSRPN